MPRPSSPSSRDRGQRRKRGCAELVRQRLERGDVGRVGVHREKPSVTMRTPFSRSFSRTAASFFRHRRGCCGGTSDVVGCSCEGLAAPGTVAGRHRHGLSMPGGNGFQLLEAIASDPQLKKVLSLSFPASRLASPKTKSCSGGASLMPKDFIATRGSWRTQKEDCVMSYPTALYNPEDDERPHRHRRRREDNCIILSRNLTRAGLRRTH